MKIKQIEKCINDALKGANLIDANFGEHDEYVKTVIKNYLEYAVAIHLNEALKLIKK